MSDADFEAPEDAVQHIAEVRGRCLDLVRTKIWGGLRNEDIGAWFKNFADTREQYFAALILDRLNYRSDSQTIALINHLFSRTLPNLVRDPVLSGCPRTNWFDWIARDPRPHNLVFVVVKDESNGVKSSQFLLYQIKKLTGLRNDSIIEPSRIAESKRQGIRNFIFIDDFMGTGHQFVQFIEPYAAEFESEDTTGVYAPLVAHFSGIEYVKHCLPILSVSPVEALSSYHQLFHENSKCFADGINDPAGARTFYYDLLYRHHIRMNGHNRRGYGQLELAYAFEHTCPDNTLPIFWWRTDGWRPLLRG